MNERIRLKGCIFCSIIAGNLPSKKVLEDELIYAFYDKNPQAPVHILIIPKKHCNSLNESNEEDISLLGHMLAKAKEIANLKKLDTGYRIVINTGPNAGQTVYHLHLHLLGGRLFGWPPG